MSTDLWAAVVLQARADVEDLPIGSTDYEAAAAFLTSPSAYWRRARDDIAAHLLIGDGEAIRKAGLRWVIARRRAEGLDDVEAPQPGKATVRAVPEPVDQVPLVIPAMLRAAMLQRRPGFSQTGPSMHKVRA